MSETYIKSMSQTMYSMKAIGNWVASIQPTVGFGVTISLNRNTIALPDPHNTLPGPRTTTIVLFLKIKL